MHCYDKVFNNQIYAFVSFKTLSKICLENFSQKKMWLKNVYMASNWNMKFGTSSTLPKY